MTSLEAAKRIIELSGPPTPHGGIGDFDDGEERNAEIARLAERVAKRLVDIEPLAVKLLARALLT